MPSPWSHSSLSASAGQCSSSERRRARRFRDAGQYGSLSGQAALAPFITDDLLAGNTEAIEKISTAGRALMTLGGAAHVKIWTVDGRVVWSDEAELIGRTFTFDEAEQRVLKGNGVLASISNLDDEENKFEIASGEKELLQVYFGTKTPTGTPVVVETYYPTEPHQRPRCGSAAQLPAAIARRTRPGGHRPGSVGANDESPAEDPADRTGAPARAGDHGQ